jgi:cell division protein FtsB
MCEPAAQLTEALALIKSLKKENQQLKDENKELKKFRDCGKILSEKTIQYISLNYPDIAARYPYLTPEENPQ